MDSDNKKMTSMTRLATIAFLVISTSASAVPRPAPFARQASVEPTATPTPLESATNVLATATDIATGFTSDAPSPTTAAPSIDFAALWPAAKAVTNAGLGDDPTTCTPMSICDRRVNSCGMMYGACYDKNYCDGNTSPYPIPTCP
ncbi:hypothetical protein AC579_9772 [Pseudocercospora musae]|uniref:Uncharacterized protein n=1 Tax=Pseudocercospora musae TaxID=113226 RepID=A0A139IGD7_9PEZI|nr:hypothetical protein AC579_9772 [Pseudocercospora musae]